MLFRSQQVGGSLGTALLNTVATTATTSYITGHQSLGQAATAFGLVHGFTQAFRVGALFLLIGATVLFFAINVGKEGITENKDGASAIG